MSSIFPKLGNNCMSKFCALGEYLVVANFSDNFGEYKWKLICGTAWCSSKVGGTDSKEVCHSPLQS